MGGGGGTTSTTVVNIPGPTEEERQLQAQQVEIQGQQLDLLKQSQEQQGEAYDFLRAELDKQNEFLQAQETRAAEFDPILKELTERELERIRSGGAATPEEIALIDEAIQRSSELGAANIQEFTQEGIEQVRDILAPSRGLRPSDSPITRVGEKIGQQGVREFGKLQTNLGAARAQAELNFPLGRDALLSGMTQFQQNLALSATQFQDQLRQQAFQNQLNLQSLRQGGAASLLGTQPSSASLLAQLAQARFASPTTTTSTRGGGGFGFNQLFQGLGATGGFLQGLGAVTG